MLNHTKLSAIIEKMTPEQLAEFLKDLDRLREGVLQELSVRLDDARATVQWLQDLVEEV